MTATMFLIATVFVGAVSFTTITRAQTEPEPTPFPPSADQKKAYVTALTAYRIDEQEFSVAKQEYIQLQTLGKLEAAVIAFREVQLARTETVNNYLQTLLSSVAEAKGMEITKKDAQIQKLQDVIDVYTNHVSTVQASSDKVGLSNTATTFSEKQEDFETLSFETLALLRITFMQSAVDQLRVATDLVKKNLETKQLIPTVVAEKQRGFEELDRTIEDVRTTIATANEFHDRQTTSTRYGASSYTQLTDMLGKGYPQLRQAESFLRELAGN